MSTNTDKKEKEESAKIEESKNNEEPTEIKQEEQINQEQIISKEESNPEKQPTIEIQKNLPEIEESKENEIIPEKIEKKTFKRETPLKITNDLVKKRFDYAKRKK